MAVSSSEPELAVSTVKLGPLSFGIAIESIEAVYLMPGTQPLACAPFYLSSFVDLHGEAVTVLDLGARLAVTYARPLTERKLMIVRLDGARIGLMLDRIESPERFPISAPSPEASFRPLDRALVAIAKTPAGPIPVIDPRAFLSQRLLADLAGLNQTAQQLLSDGSDASSS